jgi:C-type mannose receptor
MFIENANENNHFIPDPSLPNLPTKAPADGFIKYGESSYSLMKLKLPWLEAEKYCKDYASRIASILDPYSNAFAWMQMHTFNVPVWIALNSNLVSCWKHAQLDMIDKSWSKMILCSIC